MSNKFYSIPNYEHESFGIPIVVESTIFVDHDEILEQVKDEMFVTYDMGEDCPIKIQTILLDGFSGVLALGDSLVHWHNGKVRAIESKGKVEMIKEELSEATTKQFMTKYASKIRIVGNAR